MGERRYEPRRPREELRFTGRPDFMERMDSQTRGLEQLVGRLVRLGIAESEADRPEGR